MANFYMRPSLSSQSAARRHRFDAILIVANADKTIRRET